MTYRAAIDCSTTELCTLSDHCGNFFGIGSSFGIYPMHLYLGHNGDVAQMVERMLSMHEARGSIPRLSTIYVPSEGRHAPCFSVVDELLSFII